MHIGARDERSLRRVGSSLLFVRYEIDFFSSSPEPITLILTSEITHAKTNKLLLYFKKVRYSQVQAFYKHI